MTFNRSQSWTFLLAALLVGCDVPLEEQRAFDEQEEDADDGVNLEDADPGDVEDGALEQALLPEILDAEERAFLGKINAYRQSKGKGVLRVSIALCRASEFHNRDMIQNHVFQHDSSDGTDTFDRIRRYYNHNTTMGENLAMGYTTGAAVFEGWKASSGHNANMLNGDFKVIGIARNANSSGTWYWTTDFGGYRDAILSAGVSSIAANSGFESSAITTGVSWSSVRTPGRWYLKWSSGGASGRVSTAYSGSYGLRNKDPNPGAVSAAQIVLAAPNVNYAVSGRVKRLAGSTSQYLYLEFLNKDFARIAAYRVASGTSTSWTAVSTSRSSPSGTRYVRVFTYGASSSGHASTYVWDDVRLTAK